VVFDDLCDICFTVNLNLVSSLYNVDAIELFDDTKVIQWVWCHVSLDLKLDCLTCSHVFGCNNKIIYLSEDEDEAERNRE
jgi:hypothetical protein